MTIETVLTKLKQAKLTNNYEILAQNLELTADYYLSESDYLTAAKLYKATEAAYKKLTHIDSKIIQLQKKQIDVEISFLVLLNQSYKSRKLEKDYASDYLKSHQLICDYAKQLLAENFAEDNLNSVNDACRHGNKVHDIQKKLDKQLVAYFQTIIQDAIDDLMALNKPKPCHFDLILFGSLAKQVATPYSDLEFGILLPEDMATNENIKYYEVLAKLINLRIIRLGQTAIPQNLFETKMGTEFIVNFDDLVIPGWQFDLGGKTPLGRPDKDYCLIQTPSGLLEYVKDEGFERDKLLPIAVTHMRHLYGAGDLSQRYTKLVRDYLSQTNRYQQRAYQIAYQGTEYLPADIEQYFVDLSNVAKSGQLYNVKNQIYRFFDRMLENLALYHGIIAESNTEKINQLIKQQVITVKAGPYLILLDAIVYEIRLRTYLHHKGQREIMVFSYFNPDPNDQKWEKAFCLPDIQLLFYFYRCAIPFSAAIKEYFALNDFARKYFFDEMQVYQDNKKIEGMVHQRLMQYELAWQAFTAWHAEHPMNAEACYLLASVEYQLGKYDEAQAKFITLLNNISIETHFNNSMIFLSSALACFAGRGDYHEILNFYHIISQSEQLNTLMPVEQVNNKINLGIACYYLNFLQDALKYLLQAKKTASSLKIILLEQQATIELALGIVYTALDKYGEAFAAFKRAKGLYQKVYGPQPHPDYISLYHNTATVYYLQGHYQDSLVTSQLAEQQITILSSANLKPETIINNNYVLAMAYTELGRIDEAKGCYDQALFFLNSLSTNISKGFLQYKLMRGYGRLAYRTHDYITSLSYFLKALESLKNLPDKAQRLVDYAHIYLDLAACYGSLGNIAQGFTTIEYAFVYLNHLQTNLTPSDLARAFYNLSLFYTQMPGSLKTEGLKADISCYSYALRLAYIAFQHRLKFLPAEHPDMLACLQLMQKLDTKIRQIFSPLLAYDFWSAKMVKIRKGLLFTQKLATSAMNANYQSIHLLYQKKNEFFHEKNTLEHAYKQLGCGLAEVYYQAAQFYQNENIEIKRIFAGSATQYSHYAPSYATPLATIYEILDVVFQLHNKSEIITQFNLEKVKGNFQKVIDNLENSTMQGLFFYELAQWERVRGHLEKAWKLNKKNQDIIFILGKFKINFLDKFFVNTAGIENAELDLIAKRLQRQTIELIVTPKLLIGYHLILVYKKLNQQANSPGFLAYMQEHAIPPFEQQRIHNILQNPASPIYQFLQSNNQNIAVHNMQIISTNRRHTFFSKPIQMQIGSTYSNAKAEQNLQNSAQVLKPLMSSQ